MDVGGEGPRPVGPEPGTAPWAHRVWCAPDCEFRSGAVEGTHLGVAWVLSPGEGGGEQAERIALRLAEEQPGPDGRGELRVLVSVTERRLADDLDPFGEYPDQGAAGLVAITSSVGLDADEALRVFEAVGGLRALCARAGCRRWWSWQRRMSTSGRADAGLSPLWAHVAARYRQLAGGASRGGNRP